MKIGTPARLGLFIWSFILILLTPLHALFWVAGLCIVVNVAFYPEALHRLLNWRWLLLFAILVFSNGLFLGQKDSLAWVVPYSLEGLVSGIQMALRALVMLLAVDGFSSKVDVSEVAGFLERTGMTGLGFSVGIALNLLPVLRRSALNAWQSLWMRGGWRRKRWRAIRLYLVTVLSNAIRRAEEIALAAEARAYSPGRLRPWPLRKGNLDWLLLLTEFGSGVVIMVVAWK
jgi:energy-coupling factor transporter transmembrane protein EcfT